MNWYGNHSTVAVVATAGLISALAVGRAVGRAVEPAADPPPAAECAAPRSGWIFCDDFEADRLSRYFEFDDADGRFVRASGVGVDGSYGMRGRYVTTSQTSSGSLKLAFGRTPSSYMRPVDDGVARYREIYWRIYLRHPEGWLGDGADKLSRATSLASAGWAQAMMAHVWSGGAENEHLLIDPWSGTDPRGTLQTTRYNDPAGRWLGNVRGVTPIFDASHVGRWYCVEAHVRLNDPGQIDGVFTLWIDGALEAERRGLNWVGAFDAYGINAVFFENYWNAGAPVEEERYFDRIVVSTERIGC